MQTKVVLCTLVMSSVLACAPLSAVAQQQKDRAAPPKVILNQLTDGRFSTNSLFSM